MRLKFFTRTQQSYIQGRIDRRGGTMKTFDPRGHSLIHLGGAGADFSVIL